MPVILKKCFLFHYDPKINSDKVFNLFLIDNQNGAYSAISEYGRSGTKLNVKRLVENCSLSVAQNYYSAKLSEKTNHPKTPYTQTLNASTSPTFQKLGMVTRALPKIIETAKVIDFKPALSSTKPAPPAVEKESGEQATEVAAVERRSKQIGVLNLNQLDALEF